MAALAIASRDGPRFSWGGSLEVLLVGTFYGAIGGVVLAVSQRIWPRIGWWRGVGLGAALLGVAWASSTVGRQTAATAPVALVPILGISLCLFLVYGVAADVLAGTWQRPSEDSMGGGTGGTT